MTTPTARKPPRGCLPFLGIVLLGIVVAFIFGATHHSSDVKFSVDAACKHFVKAQLKAPSTAKFPSVDSATIGGTNGQYVEASYVDSDNSFGASLRSSFVCTVHKTSSGWVLDSLTGLS
jgi:hypothetical protein